MKVMKVMLSSLEFFEQDVFIRWHEVVCCCNRLHKIFDIINDLLLLVLLHQIAQLALSFLSMKQDYTRKFHSMSFEIQQLMNYFYFLGWKRGRRGWTGKRCFKGPHCLSLYLLLGSLCQKLKQDPPSIQSTGMNL